TEHSGKIVWIMLNSGQNVQDPIAIGCDATKMLRDLKLVTKDCFGFASQDDSPKDAVYSSTAWLKKIDIRLIPH
ncbi:MAG: hypothetical protein ACXWWA_13055, partial [Chitinophagaceae bacterium]